jgi:3-deoxy-D-manno-octulosonic-acid transferase
LLAEIFLRLKKQFPKLFLILVPRHFERGKEVGRQLEERGVKFVYRTGISLHSRHLPGSVECLLVNTTGELKYFYEKADLIFVGKSLTAEGGQNPIEPGALGKAMIFGPNMQNFQAIANSFLSERGAVQVRNAEELEQSLARLLADPVERRQLGMKAQKVVRENQGAIEKTVDMILAHMPDEEVYIAPDNVSR